MRSVGIEALKDKLGEYVRLAAEGETVLVTDRGRVVAELVPPRAGLAALPADGKLAELVRQGLLQPAMRRTGVPPRAPVGEFETLMRELDEDREDR